MLYKILLFPARIAIHFYCRNICVNKPEYFKISGPLLIASNHPNSFLDAIIFASLFKKPVFSLARGDAFVSTFVNRILNSLNMLPVYRVSEGAENLRQNYSTFDEVHELLKQGQIVLIFSEGRCINEWHLRPLKKGTARIAFAAWEDGMPLRVLPAGINYSSFRHFGKKVILNFGDSIGREDFSSDTTGKNIVEFNRILFSELRKLVYEISPDDIEKRKEVFENKRSSVLKMLLVLPAAIGYLLNAPLYLLSHLIIRNAAKDHYDSIMVGILFLFYPLYIIVLTGLLMIITGSWFALFFLILMPVTALALLHYRKVVP